METIRNPIEWLWDHLKHGARHVESVGHSLRGAEAGAGSQAPAIREISFADLKDALAKGFDDFAANRTDVVFLCIIYPVAGVVLARLAFGYEMLPLIFPLAFGFAFLGPVAAIGLYEMSRRREQGHEVGWADAFGTIRSPAFGTILILGLVLLVVFLAWLGAAQVIYLATLGPEPPASIAGFVRDVFTTGAGWTMVVVGVGVGFVFALGVLAISVVSFPLLLDRNAGLGAAVGTSVRAVLANPVPMVAWGLIVAAGLALGTIPLFLGLIVVMPVLGHATWHLYRKVVVR